MTRHRLRIVRLLAVLFGPRRRPEPTRSCPTLAQTHTAPDTITTVVVSLAALRRARPNHHQEPTR